MRDRRSRLLLVLITATAILFAVYIGVPKQAALIAALISGGVDLVTLATMFLEGDQQKLEKWADDLAAQVELAWSHRRDILLGGRNRAKYEIRALPLTRGSSDRRNL